MNLEIDWQKLNGFNEAISYRLAKRLPKDWHLTHDEIKSEVNESFIQLIRLYIPKTNGMSLTSWCYKYAEKITYARLKREYNKLKK